MAERSQGTVKWFSNKKGYGFITPSTEGENDVFCHQSAIHSEGYRTLGEGWEVEFEVGLDEEGKPKAENVTAIGGGPCTGPRGTRRSRRGRKESKERVSQPLWHESLKDEVKENLDAKGIMRTTGTIDLAREGVRIKLGTRGYAAMAQDDRTIAEGSFELDEEGGGEISLVWMRAIRFEADGAWNVLDHFSDLIAFVDLRDDLVKSVGVEENLASLVGEELPDPRITLEAAGFEMRRVVLSARKR